MKATHNIPKVSCDSAQEVETSEVCTQFFGSIISGGLKAGLTQLKSDIERNVGKVKDDQLLAHGNNVACESSAVNIARTSQLNLGGVEKKFLRRKLGNPSTVVELPNGDQFDTRTIMQPQHGKNNRLGEVTVKPIANGMKSNLAIDYDTPSDKFIEASKRHGIVDLCLGSDAQSDEIDLEDNVIVVTDGEKKRSLPQPINLDNAGKYIAKGNRRSRIRQCALKTKYDKTADEAEKEKSRTLVNITKTHGTPLKEMRVNEFIEDSVAMGMDTGEAREMMIEELGSEFDE